MRWYRRHARILPWRGCDDPYATWISEIMLQQTTVATVIPKYTAWLTRFPTVRSVAEAEIQDILKLWQGLGYYTRARNIHAAARIICEEYSETVPASAEELSRLPGFGPYTVNAVLSIAFNQRVPLIDTNVRRVIIRVLAMTDASGNQADGMIEDVLKTHLPQRGCGDFNQALMELGALICRSSEPACRECPLHDICRAYDRGLQQDIPPKKNSVKITRATAAAVILYRGRWFLTQRHGSSLLNGLWEFPETDVLTNADEADTIRDYLRKKMGFRIRDLRHFCRRQYFYTRFRVRVVAFQCHLSAPPPPTPHGRWLSFDDLETYPLTSGSAKILAVLLNEQRKTAT